MIPLLLTLFFISTQAFAAQKHLTIAAYDLNPYVSRDRAEHGYLYEIVTKTLEQSGYSYDIEFMPPLRARKMVESGERDILIPAYAIPSKTDKLLFSQPIHGSEIGYIQLAKEKLPSETEKRKLQDQFVSYLNDDSSLHDEASLAKEDETLTDPSSKRILSIIEMLASKRIRLAVADKLQVEDVLVNLRPNLIGKLKFIMPSLLTKNFHIAISRKNPEARVILENLSRSLDRLRKSGEYEEILKKYGYSLKSSDENSLSIGVVENSDTRTMIRLSKEFLKTHPKAKIKWFVLQENLLRRSILSGFALDDNLFDVISIGNYDTSIYAKNTWLEPLAPPKSYDQEDLLPAILSSLSLGQVPYALPFYGESSMTYYRSDLFAKHGLKMPKQPTYAEIRSFAEKIHDPKNGIFGICLRGKAGWGENMPIITTMVNVFGGSWFNRARSPNLDSKPWQEATQFYVDLLKNYGPPHAETIGYQENLQLFEEGHCGIWVDATVAAGRLLNPETSKVAATVSFTKAPTMHRQEGSHWLWTWALGIPSSSKHKALAKEFVYWATSKPYQKLVASKDSWLAIPPGTRRSLYESSEYKKAAPFSGFVHKEIETAIPKNAVDEWGAPLRGPQFVAIPEFTALGTLTGINIALALQGESTVREALKKSQQEAIRVMRIK